MKSLVLNKLGLLWMMLLLLLLSQLSYSQTLKPPGQHTNRPADTNVHTERKVGHPTDYKVLSETKDPRTGNIIRVVTYQQDGLKVTETTIFPPFPGLNERKRINTDTMNMDSVMVLVDKSQYLLAVIYKRKRIRQYRAVFGPERLKDKCQEGDRCTPEGLFKIVQVRNHSAWQKFMLLDYPNTESYRRFNNRKAKGEIAQSASIGFGIGIHGTFQGGDEMVDLGIGWTDGCVALKSTDIIDLARFVRPGTRVYIVKKY